MRRKGLGPLVFIVLVTVAALVLTFVQGNKPFLGLDLQGGVSVVLQPKGEGQSGEVTDEALDDTVAIIRSRIDAIGVAEPEITRQGDTIVVDIPGVKNQEEAKDLIRQTGELRFRPVLAQLPPPAPESESTTGTTVPSTTGDTTADGSPVEQTTETTSATTAPPPSTTAAPPAVEPAPAGGGEGDEQGLGLGLGESAGASQEPTPSTVTDSTIAATDPSVSVAPTAEVPTDPAADANAVPDLSQLPPELQAQLGASTEITPPEQDLPDQPVTLPQYDPETGEILWLYSLGPAKLTGSSLESAGSSLDQQGQWVVSPVFKGGADGIDKFNLAAGECFAKSSTCPTGQLAITLDGAVISAPSINAASFERDQITISGAFTEKAARNLATVLRYGALPVQLEIVSAQAVSATLGRDALHAGLVAGAVGLALVTLYMVAFYRLLGVAAIAKLGIETALLWSVIAWLGSSQGLALTLAGVTGIIVSIGVSLDSNVVYYEHLKDDVRAGRSLRSAGEKSFPGAWKTIVKADVASLIAAVLLYFLAVGPVRGFAFFLAVSTLLDLIVSWFFMRPGVAYLMRTDLAQRKPGLFAMVPPGAGGGAGRGPRGGGAVRDDEPRETEVTS